MFKTCTKCKETRPIDDFHNDRTGKNGKRSQCRFCVLAANKDWQARNPEHAKECWKRSSNKRYSKDVRQKRRLKSYNLSESQYTLLVSFSAGKCNICERELGTKEHIDHCHDSGKVRGLLCVKCNTAIGLLNDDAALMRRAIEYIERDGFINFASEATVDGLLPLKETIRVGSTPTACTIL